MRTFALFLAAVATAACASAPLATAGGSVSVFTAPLVGTAARPEMPEGCRKLTVAQPQAYMSELEIEGQKNPFRRQRTAAAEGGGNTLLVLKRQTSPRRTFECPSALPITDCAPDSGAWYEVNFESYACSTDALVTLNTPPTK